ARPGHYGTRSRAATTACVAPLPVSVQLTVTSMRRRCPSSVVHHEKLRRYGPFASVAPTGLSGPSGSGVATGTLVGVPIVGQLALSGGLPGVMLTTSSETSCSSLYCARVEASVSLRD